MARSLDEIISREDPKVVARAREVASQMRLDIHLAKLREQLNITQVELANSLGVKQPTVSDMERKGKDIKLSSLKRYVEASGCKLSLNVELPDGSHVGFSL